MAITPPKFTLRHRFVAAVSQSLQWVVYTSQGGLTKGLRRKGGLGFLPGVAHPETAETRFLQNQDLAGKVVYDIGGYHGLMTLFFAKTAKQVMTFEPNPANVTRIYENAALNGFTNILVITTALGKEEGLQTLILDPLMAGAASGDPEISDEIKASARNTTTLSTLLMSVDTGIRQFNFPLPDFIKIDIEGMELDALKGMADLIASRKPELYLELHGTTELDKRAKATEVIKFLINHGYRIRDVERAIDITAEVPTGRESHIYCQHPAARTDLTNAAASA